MDWPKDDSEFQKAARDALLTEAVSHTRYWINHGKDLLENPCPAQPYQRKWSELAKKDAAYRDVFQTLNTEQKEKILRLLTECVKGGIFSVMTTFDQFPGGEAEIHICVGLEGKRKAKIAPMQIDLHDDYKEKFDEENTEPSD